MLDSLQRLFRYRALISSLVARELKARYRGSVLGFLWSMVNPIVMIAVYTFAFTYVLRVPTARYTFFLLLGITRNDFPMLSAGSTRPGAGDLYVSVR